MEYKSFNKLLEDGICRNWNRKALSDYDGRTLRYSDVAWSVVKLQRMFALCGVRRGDKVAICSRNQANWGVAFMAALSAGAVPVPVLHEFKPGNIHYLVNHSDSKVLLAGSNIWENITETAMPALRAVVMLDTLQPITAADDVLLGALRAVDSDMERDFAAGFSPADLVFFKDSPDDLAIINYTSGTSGFAKGVMLPYRTLGLNVALMAESFPEITCDTNIVAMLPTAHMYGMMVDFIYEMTVGAHVHYLTRLPSPKVIMDACAAIRPDIVFTVPLMAEKVCRGLMRQMNYDYNPQSLSAEACAVAKAALEAVFGGNFSQLVIGGAPLSAEVEDFLLAIGFRYTVGSGMTECGPLVSVSRWDATKPHTCGRLAPYLSVRVDSPDASTVPGELYFKSDVLFKGYYKMPAETAEVMSADGWFRTGDIGLVGPDRFLTLKGRSKNMILTSTGHNIYPEEIESSVNNLPYVQESLIVEDRGKLLALIYPDHGQAAGDSLSDGDLYQALKAEIRTLNEALPTYCQIARFEIFPEEFEKTPKKSIKRYLYQR